MLRSLPSNLVAGWLHHNNIGVLHRSIELIQAWDKGQTLEQRWGLAPQEPQPLHVWEVHQLAWRWLLYLSKLQNINLSL
jgi:hypothetical protein